MGPELTHRRGQDSLTKPLVGSAERYTVTWHIRNYRDSPAVATVIVTADDGDGAGTAPCAARRRHALASHRRTAVAKRWIRL